MRAVPALLLMSALALAVVPSVSAHHQAIASCSDPLPLLEFDYGACANSLYHGPYVAEVTCPYERFLWEEVVGGPLSTVACIKDIFVW